VGVAVDMDVSQVGEAQVKVALNGRLDTQGVSRVETRFVGAVVPRGRDTLVDLAHVEFIGSLGIRMFISVARSLAMKNARLVLVSPQSQVRDVFDNVSLSDIIPICASEAEALSALGA
jgi:anti-anti-sigma factor